MRPSIRLLKVVVAATRKGGGQHGRARPSADNPHAETVTRWRVMPGDLDMFGHMNNSRYLLLMDFARVDYLASMGLLTEAFKNRWVIPVGAAQVDFHRSLKPFERFEIGTQVLSWNNRWFYMRQTFRSHAMPARTVATAHVKVIFRSRSGTIAPKDVVRMAVGVDVQAPTLPDDVWARFGVAAPADGRYRCAETAPRQPTTMVMPTDAESPRRNGHTVAVGNPIGITEENGYVGRRSNGAPQPISVASNGRY
jgi:acyl-CoA thioesterase FadM